MKEFHGEAKQLCAPNTLEIILHEVGPRAFLRQAIKWRLVESDLVLWPVITLHQPAISQAVPDHLQHSNKGVQIINLDSLVKTLASAAH